MKQTAKPAEADLVRLAKAGEKAAMAEIYETTYPELWRTARALVKNENDAADILQDAYLKAFTHLDGLSDPAALRPWLRQIAANTARDSLRRSRPLLFSELSDDESPFPDLPEEDVAVLPEPALDQKETSRLVRETMKDLTDGQRLVMGLYYYEDRPVKAIAETLELSENTVKGQLCSGRKKVEARLRALEEKGVRLFGLAPMAFFRALLRTRGEQLQQAAPARAMKRLAAEGPSALVSGTVRAVGAGAQLVKKVIVAAAAVAALGGAIWGIGALARQRQPDPPDQIPDTTACTSDPTEIGEIGFMGDNRLEDCTLVVTYDALSGYRNRAYLSLYELYQVDAQNESEKYTDVWRDWIYGEKLKENADFIRLLKILDFFGKGSFPPVPKQAADYPRTYAITAYYYLLGKDGRKIFDVVIPGRLLPAEMPSFLYVIYVNGMPFPYHSVFYTAIEPLLTHSHFMIPDNSKTIWGKDDE